MKTIHAIKEYLNARQTPTIQILHIVILCLVLSQLLVSNFMDFTPSGEVDHRSLYFIGTWTHIVTGITLLPISLVFIWIELKRRGFAFFFPYLTGDFEQLRNDFLELKGRKLPEPSTGGIAAIVQGLGLGALLLAVLSGFLWFLSWNYQPPLSHTFMEIHEALVGLVAAYFFGHGAMGALHVFLAVKHRKIQTS